MLTGVTGVLMIRAKDAFKSTRGDKMAEEVGLSLGFPVTDEGILCWVSLMKG